MEETHGNSPKYVAFVLQYLKRTGFIPNHPDAREALAYAKKYNLVNADNKVTMQGYDFILDFRAN